MAQSIETGGAQNAWADETVSQTRQFFRFLQDELKPFPGRNWAALRLVAAVVVTVLVSQTLRIPFPDFSAYIVFFIANDDSLRSVKLGLAAMAGATLALIAGLAVSICFLDAPWFRLPVTFSLLAGAIWLSQTLVLGVMGRLLAVILALYLSLADSIPEAEMLTQSTLWLWSIVGVGVGVTVLINFIFARDASIPSPEKKPAPEKGFLVADAWGNPAYGRFALKTVLAVIACEVLMNAVAWRGLRTSMITCVVTALAATEARHQKQALRLVGVCGGGLLGLGVVIFLVPRMDSIVELLLLTAVSTYGFAWVATGSPRSSYAGFQMALAFYLVLFPGFDTSIDLTSIRDRLVGIILGLTAMWIFFDHLWPSPEREI